MVLTPKNGLYRIHPLTPKDADHLCGIQLSMCQHWRDGSEQIPDSKSTTREQSKNAAGSVSANLTCDRILASWTPTGFFLWAMKIYGRIQQLSRKFSAELCRMSTSDFNHCPWDWLFNKTIATERAKTGISFPIWFCWLHFGASGSVFAVFFEVDTAPSFEFIFSIGFGIYGKPMGTPTLEYPKPGSGLPTMPFG